MTLIDASGTAVEDLWHYPRTDGDLEPMPNRIVRLADWDTYRARFSQTAAGVWIAGEQEVAGVLPLLERAGVIVVEFPKSRDGRGFTLGRMLRQRHHYAGDLRAAGPLLPDQFPMLLQCGYTSLIAPASVPLARWRDAASALRTARPRTLLDQLTRNR